MKTSKMLQERLSDAYFPKLNPASRAYYRNLIGEIMEKISIFPAAEWDKPLSETYLIGYYLQRNDFYRSKNTENTKEENDTDR